MLQVICGLIISIGILLWLWKRSVGNYWEKNGVSYISGPPFIGVLKEAVLFRKSLGEVFFELYNHEKFKDEPITGVYFFHKPSLLVRHPEIIKNVLVRDFPNFMDRGVNSGLNDVIGRNNLLTLKGDRWRAIRQKMSPFLTTGKLKNFFLLVVDVTNVLEEKLSSEIGGGVREYEMKEFASLFTMDTIAICAFGVQSNCLLNPNAEFHKKAKTSIEFTWKRGIEFSTCFFLPELAVLFGFPFFSHETNKFLKSTVNYVMEERAKSGTKRNDLIDILIAMREEDPKLFNGDTIVAQAASFLLAGYETSSSAISFALFELARHPEKQEKLSKEIRNYAAKYGSLQYETINEMDYLNCVIQEILRLYPSLPFLDRICFPSDGAESYSLEPYHKFAIPRGMSVYIPVIGLHRDPNYFTNPLEFIPERFSPENRDTINQYTFLTFGLGPRACVGQRFGYLQVKMALFTILRNYRVEATERTPKTIKFDKKALVTHSEMPLYLNLRRI